jgi:hypothetical protein
LTRRAISGNISGDVENRPMASPTLTPIERHRRRIKRRGIVRVEVQVRREDAALVRRIAGALADPARSAAARALLRSEFLAPEPKGLKALLAASPLEGVDLERQRDTGRTVKL